MVSNPKPVMLIGVAPDAGAELGELEAQSALKVTEQPDNESSGQAVGDDPPPVYSSTVPLLTTANPTAPSAEKLAPHTGVLHVSSVGEIAWAVVVRLSVPRTNRHA